MPGLPAQVVVVELGLVAAVAGGPVDRGIGLAEHLVGVGVGGRVHGHPDAGGEVQGDVPGHERGSEGDPHPVGEIGDVVDGALGDVEDGELVGPHAGDHVVGVHGAGQPLGDREQQAVADVGAVAVDELLEGVEVDDDHRDERVGAGEPVEGLVDAVPQQGPVG